MSRWKDGEPAAATPELRALLGRRGWSAAAVAAGVWAIAWSLAWLLPAQFESRSVIQIAPAAASRDAMLPNLSAPPLAQLPALMERLMSPAHLGREAQRLRLYPRRMARGGPAAAAARLRAGLRLAPLASTGSPRVAPATALLEVRFRDAKAARAERVVEALTADWVRELRRNAERRSAQTTAFLEQQAQQAAARQARRARAVEAYQHRYSGELPVQAAALQQEISGDQDRLAAAQRQAHQARQQQLYLDALLGRYQGLQRQMAADPSSHSPARQALEAQRTAIAAQLAQLATEDTPDNPDLQALRQKLAALTQLENRLPAASPAQLPLTAEMMQLASQRQANRLALAAAQADERRLATRLARRRRQLAQVPLRGQELAALESRLQQAQAAYSSLATEAQQAALANALELRQQGAQTRILTPATRPHAPSWPDRARWNWMGLLLGLAAGAAAAMWQENRDDRLWSRAALPGGAIWAAIPRLATDEERRSAQWRLGWRWAAVGLVCGLMAAGSWLVLR